MPEPLTSDPPIDSPPEFIPCPACGELADEDDVRPVYGTGPTQACRDCRDNDYTECEDCGRAYPNDDMHSVGDRSVCPRCIDHYSTCEDCDEIVPDDETTSINDRTVCDSCRRSHYSYCNACGEYVHDDDYAGDGYCNLCDENREYDEDDDDEDDDDDSIILPHANKGALERKGKFGSPRDKMFLGIELEMSRSGVDLEDAASEALRAIGYDFAVCKRDCSIDPGFELVTAPATPAIATKRFGRFFDAHEASRKSGGALGKMRSWDTGEKCGMHVHVSRAALSGLTLGKLLYFINAPENRTLLTAIAGRAPNRYCEAKEKKITDAREDSRDRFEAINTTNTHTIEFRIFRGTLKRSSFFKNLEFVVASIRFCRDSSLCALTASDFLSWLAPQAKTYPNLVAFLREKTYLPSVLVLSGEPTPETEEV